MAISFGLVEEKPKSLRTKRGRKSFFTPEGKVALAFMKMYTGLSAPKLIDALNGNIHYQIFCGIRISPENQLINYKLIDSILLELSKTLKMIMRQLALLGKILDEIRRQMRIHPDEELLNDKQLDMLDTITEIYRQQKNHFNSGDSRESIPNRIVSVSKPYITIWFYLQETYGI